MTAIPNVTLNDGVTMPQLGFGVFQVPDDETKAAVSHALAAGYRSIDTAAAYRNEEAVGHAIAESDVPRDDLFVTTKLWNADQGYDKTLRAFDTSLAKLGLDRLDLYLVHWPTPARGLQVETWKAFAKLLSDGRVRSVGVSNFQPEHLEQLVDATGVVPSVNQVELHPFFNQAALREFHTRHGITTEAWSPLGQGGELLSDRTVAAVAAKHDRTPAQVVLRWHLQLGTVVIPKSVTPARIAENADVFDFALDDEDVAALSGLDTGKRLGPDPDTFNQA
ncbi:aldo/keto reductase [Umezawaea tangerina]|uniref:Diketogulonate reductase-like aldo/keto reductase n=1 Tax=Umezawaea tangerina TaxID=84725 RepID=A0A2T0T4N3_9PSEU|nr:aldo/keto reductase [Umezawaea tangerina]PRY40645.1 diketogulonate reductase-like aldo/keto reductase [Umezawaea tangerina]